ncbi:MAG: ECF-type sigma factor [Lysobacterales bacterium]
MHTDTPASPPAASADLAAELEQVSSLLRAAAPSAPEAWARWMREAQADLRRVAHAERVAMRAGETLSTTALVHEAYLRFAQSSPRFVDRKHFFATAARAMRQILVDYLRQQRAQKRGGGAVHGSLDEAQALAADQPFGVDLLILDSALNALEQALPRPAQVVHLRFFAGLDDREIGEILGVDESTVRRDWAKARGWLYLHLGGEPG